MAYRMLGRAHYELDENTEARNVFLKGTRWPGERRPQTVKEIDVFLRRFEKREVGRRSPRFC